MPKPIVAMGFLGWFTSSPFVWFHRDGMQNKDFHVDRRRWCRLLSVMRKRSGYWSPMGHSILWFPRGRSGEEG